MYLLPAIRIEEVEVRLPCPALHLLQLAARVCGPLADDDASDDETNIFDLFGDPDG